MDNRTEKPTQKRRSESRSKGNMPASPFFVSGLLTLFVTSVLYTHRDSVAGAIAALIRSSLSAVGKLDHMPGDPARAAAPSLMRGVLVLILGAILVAGVRLWQTKLAFFPKLILFKPQRLKPKLPFQQGNFKYAIIGAGVTIGYVLALTATLLLFAWLWREPVGVLARTTPAAAAIITFDALTAFFLLASLIMLIFGILDYIVRFMRTEESMKMTKQEIKDERRSTEGDEMVKAQRFKFGRQMMRQNAAQMRDQVQVVISNPTHVAIALAYHPEKCPVPIVADKGLNLRAQAIKAAFAAQGVPIIRKPWLARQLYARCEIGSTIPTSLFVVVAEVLATVMGRTRRHAPSGRVG